MHRSGWVYRIAGELGRAALIRGRPPVSARSRRRTRRGSLEPADVALQLRAGDPAAAADVEWVELAGLHQRVDRRAPDAEHRGGLLGCEQQRVAGDRLPRSLRVAHLALLVLWPRAPASGAARPPGEGAISGRLVTVPGEVPGFLQSLLSSS